MYRSVLVLWKVNQSKNNFTSIYSLQQGNPLSSVLFLVRVHVHFNLTKIPRTANCFNRTEYISFFHLFMEMKSKKTHGTNFKSSCRKIYWVVVTQINLYGLILVQGARLYIIQVYCWYSTCNFKLATVEQVFATDSNHFDTCILAESVLFIEF